MHTAHTSTHRPASTNWLLTAAVYGVAIAALAAFAFLGVEESRMVLIG